VPKAHEKKRDKIINARAQGRKGAKDETQKRRELKTTLRLCVNFKVPKAHEKKRDKIINARAQGRKGAKNETQLCVLQMA